LPAFPADFSPVAHYRDLLSHSSTGVVWSLLLHADSEGPSLIFNHSIENLILQAFIRVAQSDLP